MEVVGRAVVYAIAPVAGMIGAGAAAAVWGPGARVRGYVQHLAAGVVFAVVGVEILPGVVHRGRPLAAALGFTVGVAAMLIIRAMSRRAERAPGREADDRPWALLTAVVVDVFVDGLLIGVAVAAGRAQGVLVALGLTGCTVSLGLATSTELVRRGASSVRASALTAGIGLTVAIGALVGALVGTRLTGGWMEAVLAFACAALLYLVTEELLLEAHRTGEEPETPLTTAVFFIGFLAVLVLNMTF